MSVEHAIARGGKAGSTLERNRQCRIRRRGDAQASEKKHEQKYRRVQRETLIDSFR